MNGIFEISILLKLSYHSNTHSCHFTPPMCLISLKTYISTLSIEKEGCIAEIFILEWKKINVLILHFFSRTLTFKIKNKHHLSTTTLKLLFHWSVPRVLVNCYTAIPTLNRRPYIFWYLKYYIKFLELHTYIRFGNNLLIIRVNMNH